MQLTRDLAVVLTGSSGYLGRRVANRLRANQFYVIEIDRLNSLNPIDLGNDADRAKLNLPDNYMFIHLAFPLPGSMNAKNFEAEIGNINVNLKQWFSPQRSLLISSTAVYPIKDSDKLGANPWEIYGRLKLATENLLAECFNELTIFRPGTLIELDRESSMMRFMSRIKFSRFPVFPGSGKITHPFTHTQDLENAILLWALNQIKGTGVYDITANEPMTLRQLCFDGRSKRVLFEIRIPQKILCRIGSDRFPIAKISRWHFRALCYDYSNSQTNEYRKNFRPYKDLFTT